MRHCELCCATSFSTSRRAPAPPPTRRAGSPRASPISSAARRRRGLPDAAALAQIPTDADLSTAGPAGSLAYDRAWWFSRFVAEAYGTDTLRALYLRACGPGHPDAATAMRDTLGADLPTVLARWRHWMSG